MGSETVAWTLESSSWSLLWRRWPKQQIMRTVRMMPRARPEKKPTKTPEAGNWLHCALGTGACVE